MSFISCQHEARKARLQRFAEAAARLNVKQSTPVDRVQIDILEKAVEEQPEATFKVIRREYETVNNRTIHVPITSRILRAVSEEFGMPVSEIISHHQEPKYTTPRYVATGLMLQLTNMSLPAIGRRLGGRDHTTIIAGRRRIDALLEGEAFRNRFDQIKASISA